MKFRPFHVACSLLFSGLTMTAHAAVDYVPIDDAAVVVTGVRSSSATEDDVVLTASYVFEGVTYATLYQGSLVGSATAPDTSWNRLTPVFEGQTVTSATFYGPNTPLFDPRIAAGDVVAVGSYKYNEGASGALADHGVLYEGPATGGGTWTQIDATPLVPQGETLLNTIAHSTMGDLVVGNYDTHLATGRAFIYNKVTGEWTNLNPGNTRSVTAYGIWQNGGPSSTSYTIAGGQSDVGSGGVDESYLVKYDSATGAFSHYRVYRFENRPISAALVHFDGITGTDTGYNLTGTVTSLTSGQQIDRGFMASVSLNPNGSFGPAVWTPVAYPGSVVTTGNTIVENNVLGIFVTGEATQSYIATVDANYGVAVSASKSGRYQAVYTIANTGDTAASFSVSRVVKISKRANGPGPSRPRKPHFKIQYTLDGASVTSALESGTVDTATLEPGGTAQLVEKVNIRHKVARKRTIRTTVTALCRQDETKSASATVKFVLKP